MNQQQLEQQKEHTGSIKEIGARHVECEQACGNQQA